MSFSWSHPSNPGDYVTRDNIVEIRNSISVLGNKIFGKKPISSYTVTFNEPLNQNDFAKDSVMDELQTNLDNLKKENYCRGYFANQHTGYLSSDLVAVQNNKCNDEKSTLCSVEKNSDQTTFHGTRYSTYKNVDKSSNYNTRHSVRASKYHNRFDCAFGGGCGATSICTALCNTY